MKNIKNGFASSKLFVVVAALVLIGGVGYSVSQAVLIDGPEILTNPPTSLALGQEGATNVRQQAFDEKQNVLIVAPVKCTNTVLQPSDDPASESRVNSHMIFYNESLEGGSIFTNTAEWTFENEILCYMKDGIDQSGTDSLFGLDGTSYPGPTDRGMETKVPPSQDEVIFEAGSNKLTVTMTDTGPGDRLRVLTRYVPPPDTTAPEVSCIKQKGGVYEIVATDDRDEIVLAQLTDTVSGQVFKPFESGMLIKHTLAKGAKPSMKPANNANDFTIRSQGDLTISATDEASNPSSEVICTSK